jgi:hypothetical protein
MAGTSNPNTANSGGLMALLNQLANGGATSSIDPSTGLPIAAPPNPGLGQIGLQMLANNTPSPVRQPLGAILGKSVLSAQDSALQQALQRQQLQSGQLQLQNQIAMLQALNGASAGGQGSQLPIDAPDSSDDSSASPNSPQQAVTPNGTTVTANGGAAPTAAPPASAAPLPSLANLPASPNGLTPAMIQRIQALANSSAAPPGAQVPAAPSGANAAIPGLPGAPFQPSSAAPPGAPAPRQLMPPGGSGQLPPNFPAFRPTNAPVPNWLTPPTASQIGSLPVGGVNAQALQRLALFRGGDPVATAEKVRAQQLAIAQQRYAPAIARLDTLTQSDVPTKYVAADPGLSAAWQKLAPQLGMDPQKDFNDQNVRTAFTFGRNQLAGALSEAAVAPNVMLQNMSIGNGGTVQVDPRTGKVTPGISQQETAQFVMPDGSVQLLSKVEGMARHLQPYDAGTYINQGTVGPSAAAIAAYKAPPLIGTALRTPQGQNVMASVYKLNPSYDATTYAVRQKAREDFATGDQGNTVRSLSTATDHLNQLSVAATAMQNRDTKVLNRVGNYFSQEFGGANVPNFEAMKQLVGDEVAKAVIGSSGGVGDRQGISDAFAAVNSPDQIQGVIQKYKGLMGGQLNGLRRQYQRSTGLDDFNSMISPAAGRQLGGGSSKTGPLSVGDSTNVGGFTVTRTN